MGRLVHFEIHVDDMERAKKFYGEVFSWQGYYIDPEGNIFGIHQPDENAK